MDELQYFQSTEPPGQKMGVGRFVACGSILLLMGAAGGFVFLITLNSILRFSSSEDFFLVVWIAVVELLVTATLIALGVGALCRRRWCRPLILAVCWPWAVCGSIFSVAMFTVVGRDYFRFSYRWTGWEELFWIAASMGMTVIIAVALPLTCILLLRSDRVQQALNDRDLNARWTDTWPVVRLTLLVSSAILTVILSTISLNIAHTQWPAMYPTQWFSLVIAAATGVASVIASWLWRAVAWWLSLTTVGITLAVLAASTQWLFGGHWSFEDTTFWAALLAPLVALLVLHGMQYPHRRPRQAVEA